jgi:hypothetical protein
MNPKQAFEQIKKYMELFIQEYEEEEEDTTAQSRNLETNLNNETEMS